MHLTIQNVSGKVPKEKSQALNPHSEEGLNNSNVLLPVEKVDVLIDNGTSLP